ncbi:DUF551 domain-containing protein [Escherichia coli]|uniref:DUF551 domain-containing protein n=1 Tax=Escherichia coli TaxID=562 RepID=UPI000BE4C23B
MITITKERLLTIKQWRETYGPGSNVALPAEEAEELARIALASLEAEPVAYIIQDSDARSRGEKGILRYFANISDEDINEYEITVTPLYAAPPETASVPDAMEIDDDFDSAFEHGKAVGWNACRTAMLQSGNFRESKNSSTNNFREIPEASTSSPVTPALLPGGFTIEEAKELHEDLVRSHISKALSGEKMKKKDRDADLRWIHGVIVQAAWFVKASLEQNALSGNSRLIPGEVLSAIREVAKIRADFDDFDGDRRGIGDCLDEAEQELIVTINKYASQLAAEPIAPNDVREQTAIPQVPVTPDGWISCSERMPSEEDVLVYCSDTKEQVVGFHKGKGLFQFFYMNGVEGVCEPSHWMPLPEPPL